MINKLIVIVGLALCVATACASESDFDKVCNYFEDLKTQTTGHEFSKTDKLDFINKRVKKELKPDSAARQAWEVVIFAMPEVRYELYKTSAEEVTKNSWQCTAMEALIVTTGE